MTLLTPAELKPAEVSAAAHFPSEPTPAALASLIRGAVASFDVDRDASRRYLLRASALLRVKYQPAAHSSAAPELSPRRGLALWQLNRIVDYIEAHLTERITGRTLAELIEVSVGQLFRAFKASVGVSPFLYIARRRVEVACAMLRTTREPLSQIAIACGLCDQSHFSRVFRRLVGCSPGVWRRVHAIESRTSSPMNGGVLRSPPLPDP